MVNVPPSTKTKPGPVSCSTDAATSKPPLSSSLYAHPVAEETLPESVMLSEQAVKRKTAIIAGINLNAIFMI
jgi:hypothetical protein